MHLANLVVLIGLLRSVVPAFFHQIPLYPVKSGQIRLNPPMREKTAYRRLAATPLKASRLRKSVWNHGNRAWRNAECHYDQRIGGELQWRKKIVAGYVIGGAARRLGTAFGQRQQRA